MNIHFVAAATQSGRSASPNVRKNISEVDNTTSSNVERKEYVMSKEDETNAAVAALSSMFPTVEQTYMRDLLKK